MSIDGKKMLLLGVMPRPPAPFSAARVPLCGAAQSRVIRGGFGGSSRCTGLLDREGGDKLLSGEHPLRTAAHDREQGEDDAYEGAPAARGYWIYVERHGAAYRRGAPVALGCSI